MPDKDKQERFLVIGDRAVKGVKPGGHVYYDPKDPVCRRRIKTKNIKPDPETTGKGKNQGGDA